TECNVAPDGIGQTVDGRVLNGDHGNVAVKSVAGSHAFTLFGVESAQGKFRRLRSETGWRRRCLRLLQSRQRDCLRAGGGGWRRNRLQKPSTASVPGRRWAAP